ncbi:MAG: DUF3368 domain-containing protein [Phycisphaerales bacterium]
MIVVSDASPLNILVRVGCVHVLESLFGEVWITPRVVSEMTHPHSPAALRAWVMNAPAWLHTRSPATLAETVSKGAGEREAISLALELNASLLLVDDLKARQDAKRLGLAITGTLGVLERAAEQRLISLPEVVVALRRSDFRIADELLNAALERDRPRKGR